MPQVAGKDNTDEITEGPTNLYFTHARADARIGAASLTDPHRDVNTGATSTTSFKMERQCMGTRGRSQLTQVRTQTLTQDWRQKQLMM